MSKPLAYITFKAPGFSGLNSQDSSVALSNSFATDATNCVIDTYGRVGSRKGWSPSSAVSVDLSTAPIKTLVEIQNDTTSTYLSAGNNKLFTGLSTLTQLNPRNLANTANLAYTITDDHWQAAVQQFGIGLTASIHALFVQEGHKPLLYHKLPLVGNGATATVTTAPAGKLTGLTLVLAGVLYNVGDPVSFTTSTGSGATGTVTSVNGSGGITGVTIVLQGASYVVGQTITIVDTGSHFHEGDFGFQLLSDFGQLPAGHTTDTFKPNVALAAYGRVWVADIENDRQTVYFSDTNIPYNFLTGTAGYLNIASVVPENQHITALAANNGFLIIFTQQYIIVYANPSVPSLITLQDTINGTGCVARDTVAKTGNDVFFLSDRGVQSLQRIVQEKSMPLRDVSKNVRDNLLAFVSQEVVKNIKAVYYERDAFYLLNLPVSKVTYCFDMRSLLEDGSTRTTTWNTIEPSAFLAATDRNLYIGKPGYIGKYTGYLDNTSIYRLSYFTNYVDMDKPGQDKILKKISLVLIGASNQPIIAKWGFDYSTVYQAATRNLGASLPAEFGLAQYNINEYSVGVDISNFTYQASGTGKVVQLGIESDINGSPLSIQKLDLFVKEAKIR